MNENGKCSEDTFIKIVPARKRMRPDYDGGSILNVMSSIIKARGGKSSYQEAKLLGSKELKSAKKILLLVLDGLSYEWLCKHGGKSFLYQHMRGKVTSVFPTTTAAAMTTIYTGVPPAEHGFTGWYMFFREMGMLIAPLPPWSRSGKIATPQADVSILLKTNPIFEKIKSKGVQIVPSGYIASPYNNFLAKKATLLHYKTLSGWLRQTKKAMRMKEKGFILSYWPSFDTFFHEEGSMSKELHDHFWELDATIERLAKSLEKGSVMVITADHGLIDTEKKRLIDLEKYPKVKECLALPLCGEHRLAYAYIKPGKENQFKREIKRFKQVTVKKSSTLIKEGWFGSGKKCDELPYRVGDYTLFMDEKWVIQDTVLGEVPNHHIGRHGCISKEEMLVPLIFYKK